MFYYVCGELVLKEDSMAVVDCGGIGYKFIVSSFTASSLGAVGKNVTLFTYLQVREDALELYGFHSKDEHACFKLLLTVSGVGPKAAISILSVLSPDKLALAVCGEDTRSISRAPGVGAKTAARVILELKDKLGSFGISGDIGGAINSSSADPASPRGGKFSEAVDALSVLGYSRAEILNALRGINLDSMPLEEIIRTALKKFGN